MTLLKSGGVFFAICLILAGDRVYATDEPSVDPCTLITKAEVEQIIGQLSATPTSSRESA